jgi:AcrR family transcriptional regulator
MKGMANNATRGSKRRRMPAAERRTQIVNAARDMFVRYGYSGTRTRHIAEAAGVTEAVLYQHFPSKEALFDDAIVSTLTKTRSDILMHTRAVAEAALRRDPEETEEAEAELYDIINGFLPELGAALYSDPEYGRTFYSAQFLPRMRRMATSHSSSFVAEPDDRASEISRYVISAIYGMNLGYALHAHFGGGNVSKERAVHEISTILSSGIGG